MESTRYHSGTFLDTTGFLYEGNFDAWQNWMGTVLVVHGRPTQAYPSIESISKEDAKPIYHTSNIEDLQLILARISPELKARIPIKHIEAKSGVLYAWFEKLCQPFRLFDLPAELRVRVYGEVVGDSEQSIHGNKRARPPTLAQASQQLRQEVVPVYIANTTFRADCSSSSIHINRWFLTSWEVAWPTPWFKHLKRFKLSLTADLRVITGHHGNNMRRVVLEDIATFIDVTFNESKGLKNRLRQELEAAKSADAGRCVCSS